MSTPEHPSGPPVEAGSPPPAEPGHRARALAASLLGELTGQRKSGLTFSPLDPTGLSVSPREASREEPSPGDAAAPAPLPAEQAHADAPVTVARVADEAPEGSDGSGGSDGDDRAVPGDDDSEPVRDSDDGGGAAEGSDAGGSDAADDVPTLAPGPVPQLEPSWSSAARSGGAAPRPEAARPAAGDRPAPAGPGTEPAAPPPTLSAPPQPAPQAAPAPAPQAAPPAAPQVAPPAAAQAAPPTAPQSAGPATTRASAPAPERPAGPTVSTPSPSAALAAPAPAAAAPVRSGEGAGGPSSDVRPAPFAYLAVAQHHTTPARATANGALDQAGQRISSRVDRALVRRAALVTIEAASLLDACDVLDRRARAVDATWTGEHHSPTEVREFEGAWGAFYDAQGALAQHVTGG